METTHLRPLILPDDGEALDPLATFETMDLPAHKLRPGMVIVDRDDPIGFAAGIVDHRQRMTGPGARRSGGVQFLVWVTDEGLKSVGFHANTPVRVAVR